MWRMIMIENAVHLCVDMQIVFKEKTSWHLAWMERVLPRIEKITSAYSDRTFFTRFIPAWRPGEGQGTWRAYYERWPKMTIEKLGMDALNIVPELLQLAPYAPIIDKHFYAPWLETDLHEQLQERHAEVLIVTGGETDVCVLSTIAGAIDLGYKVIVVRDALCSSSNETHDAILRIYHERYSLQVDVMESQALLQEIG